MKKEFEINDILVSCSIWDTAGEEKFRAMTKMYTKDAQCAIVMYDITQHATWKAVNYWIKQLRDETDDPTIIVVGNKLDLIEKDQSQRAISFDEVQVRI